MMTKKIYSSVYYAKHREKILEKKKGYYQKNKEKMKADMKRYYAENRDKIRKKQNEHYAIHRKKQKIMTLAEMRRLRKKRSRLYEGP